MAQLRGPVLLVGGGRMGGALARGWLARGLPADELLVVEPDGERRAELTALGLPHVKASPDGLPGLDLAALVLAVKPQLMDDVAPPYRAVLGPRTLLLSIAAGRTIESFERLFGADRAIVRAMPNTPAAVARGATVLCAGKAAGGDQRALAEALMAAVGHVFWVEDEELLHAVTALSGGGPAYVFLLIEAMAAAGVRLGLPSELAMRLARLTVCGSGELAFRSDEPAPVLRRNVTSPKGTTERALGVLMGENGLEPMMARALAAAAERSRELAG